MLPVDRAVALVDRVRASAKKHATIALAAVVYEVPRAFGIALRVCPPLPPTIAERITDSRAKNLADWVMYRQAFARAAEARGWPVHWYDAKHVLESARKALQIDDFDAYFLERRKTLGPPWNNDHKLALAAAVAMARNG